MVQIRYRGSAYLSEPAETVLDVLLRHGVELSYSCRKGTCLSCLLRVRNGALPPDSQEGLRETLRENGYFLACRCVPARDLDIAAADDAALFERATVAGLERLSESICRVLLAPAKPLDYRAGQFINLRRHDGLVRSYSLASVPRLDKYLELQVKRLPGGLMSNWIFDDLRPGESVDFQGPNGESFYLPSDPAQPMLLIGNGSGLGPLSGIARDALHDGHRGSVWLYHGSRAPEGLYLQETLRRLARAHANFSFVPCLSGAAAPAGHRVGRAEAVAFAEHGELVGWRVFLCGSPAMVHAAKKAAYLAGAKLDHIHADPFELRELRKTPRGVGAEPSYARPPAGSTARNRAVS